MTMAPEEGYESGALFTGFLEGYNTMDALAALAFGIVVIEVIRGLGVEQPGQIAKDTVKAGIFSRSLMARDLCAGYAGRRTEPRRVWHQQQWRRGSGADRRSLFRRSPVCLFWL